MTVENEKSNVYTLETNNSITMEGSTDVVIDNTIKIVGTYTSLPVKVIADFSKIPQELHEMYIQALVNQYDKNSVVWNNLSTKDEVPPKKKSNLDKIIDILTNHKNWKRR
jgi:hypothetical protein